MKSYTETMLHFCSKDTHKTFLLIYLDKTIGLLWACLLSFVVIPVVLAKRLTQIFVDCNRFDQGERPFLGTAT